MLQFLKLTLYNELNLSVRFQDYFGHVWEHSDPALGNISAQPHTVVKQICFLKGKVLFLSLFCLPKNWMHNIVRGLWKFYPALLWKIWLKREQNLNRYLLCQIFYNMNYWGFVFLLFFHIQQPKFFKREPYYTVKGLHKLCRKNKMLSWAVLL